GNRDCAWKAQADPRRQRLQNHERVNTRRADEPPNQNQLRIRFRESSRSTAGREQGAVVASTHTYFEIPKKPPIVDQRTSSQILIRFSPHDLCAENSILAVEPHIDEVVLLNDHQRN